MVKSFLVASLAASLMSLRVYALDAGRLVTQYGEASFQAEQGMPQSSAKAILQDRDGYLWFATEEGLARFDGVRFVVFDKSNTPAMVNQQTLDLAEDRQGRLWIASGDGLLCRDGERFVRFSTRDGLPSNRILTVIADGSDLWIGTAAGAARYRRGKFVSYGPNLTVRRILRDRAGTIWLGTGSGLARVVGGTVAMVPFPVEGAVTALYEDHSRAIWIGTTAGLFRMRDGAIEPASIALPAGVTVTAMREDSDGNFWIGTREAGVFRVRDGRVDAYGTREGLAHPYVRCIIEDREGSLWIGTNGGGAKQLRDTSFLTYGSLEGLSGQSANTIVEGRDGAIWVGTAEGGITRYDEKGGVRTLTSRDGLAGDFITSLAFDGQGTLWAVGKRGVNLIRGNRVVAHLTAGDGLPGDAVVGVQPDAEGVMWIATDQGVARWLRERVEITPASVFDGAPLTALAAGPDGSIYVGTGRGGVFRHHAGSWSRVVMPPALRANVVLAILADRDGTLWVTTNGGGLAWSRGERSAVMTTAVGLFDDLAGAILDDRRGSIWFASNRGVSAVRRSELVAVAEGRAARLFTRVYGIRDGMRSAEINHGFPGGVVARDGAIWFPTTKGAVRYIGGFDRRDGRPKPALIESLTVDGARMPRGSWEIPANAQRVEVAYTALYFAKPAAVVFRYMLEGVDRGWVSAGPQRTASYTNVPPGRFRFRVSATTGDGVWHEAPPVTLARDPRFYETFWFRTVLMLLLALALWGAYLLRTIALRRRQQELVRLVEKRTEELRHANRELTATNMTMKLILDSAGDGIFGIDANGAVTFINPAGASTLGWTADELLGREIHPLMHADVPHADCGVCRPALGETTRTAQAVGTRDGRAVSVETCSTAIAGEGNAIHGVVVTFRDVSERLAIEQMKDEFVATVSHELRTPLTAIRGSLGLLRGGMLVAPSPKAQRMLDIAATNCERLLRLVGDMLDAERLTSGRIELRLGAVDALSIMSQAADMLQSVAGDTGVTLRVEPVEATVVADADRLVQMLTNLIANAIKFSPAGGEVAISADSRGAEIVFHVADQGRGIPRDKLRTVFERFRQVESSDAHEKGGSGLGLAICRGIAEAHGGRISVDSEMGLGSRFSVALPHVVELEQVQNLLDAQSRRTHI